MYIAEVMMLKVESDRDSNAVDVTIQLKRHPANQMYAGVPPDVKDLPPDFRKALEHWLGLELNPSPPVTHTDLTLP